MRSTVGIAVRALVSHSKKKYAMGLSPVLSIISTLSLLPILILASLVFLYVVS